MRIVLTKKHKVDYRILPKGTEMSVSNEKGKMLIKKKVAKQLDRLTKEEEVMEDVKDAINKAE